MSITKHTITEFLYKNILALATIAVLVIFSNWQITQFLSNNARCCLFNNTGLQHDFFFQPYFSVLIQKAIRYFFGNFGELVISQTIIPSIIFYLIATIFNRYLTKLWSLTIAFVAVFSFQDLPFRDFLVSLIKSPATDMIGSSLLPEITNFPIPSLSVLSFLLLFYYSTKPTHLDKNRIAILTAIWSLQFYISAIDAAFGLFFWFSYLLIRITRKTESNNLQNIYTLLLYQMLLSFVIVTPTFILADFSVKNSSITENFSIHTYCILYALTPIMLTFILFKIHKVDIREILYKFWPIYILMFVEFFMVLISFSLNEGVNLKILTNSIPMFFLHFYYYLPVIFYASREYYPFNIGKDGSHVANTLRRIVYISFNKLSYIYLPAIIIAVILFALVSAHNFNSLLNQ